MFNLQERIIMDAGANVRRTSDGYLVAAPRVARTGIQLYLGREVGRDDLSVVRVFRPEASVFDAKAMASLAYKPITNDHPPEMVTDKNWKKYGIGQAGGEVARDGQFVRVPMVLMDGAAISDFEAGKAELSVGYTCDIKWEEGVFDGQKYDAIQTDIRANHIAVVDAARGGDQLRIGDGVGSAVNLQAIVDAADAISKGGVNSTDVLTDGSALNVIKEGSKQYPFFKDGIVYEKALRQILTDASVSGDKDVATAADSLLKLIGGAGLATRVKDANEESTTMNDKTQTLKSHLIDGITVEMTDVASQVVDRHIATLNAALTDANKAKAELQAKFDAEMKAKDEAIAKLTTDAATATAKIATLETQVKDGALTPEKIDALVKDRAVVAGKAKAVLSTVVTDGKTDAEIMKQVVLAKVGDAAKDWNDVMVKASFDTLTSGVKADAAPSNIADQHRAFSSAPTNDATSLDAKYDARDKKLSDAWKAPSGQA